MSAGAFTPQNWLSPSSCVITLNWDVNLRFLLGHSVINVSVENLAEQPKYVIGTKDFEVVQFAELDTEFKVEFTKRADRWQKETAIHSAPAQKYLHPDYIVIIAKGIESPRLVVPLILNRIKSKGGDWFFALKKIAGENPAQNSETFSESVELWIEWARRHEYIKNAHGLLAA